MKFRLFSAALICAAVLSGGCASMPYGKYINEFTVVPDKGIKAGTIVTATVKTTPDVAEVYGSIDIMGSPRIKLRYDENKKYWYFRYMIPMTFVVPQGEYVLKAEVITKAGDKSYAQKKVSTY